MYNPVRGGTRGGQGDFKWSDVASDKDREHYLGHSILAPVGRWQQGKDLTWYNKDRDADAAEAERRRKLELKKIKEAEEDALALALGYAPVTRRRSNSPHVDSEYDSRLSKEEKERAKEQRRIEKEARRADRAAHREMRKAHTKPYPPSHAQYEVERGRAAQPKRRGTSEHAYRRTEAPSHPPRDRSSSRPQDSGGNARRLFDDVGGRSGNRLCRERRPSHSPSR